MKVIKSFPNSNSFAVLRAQPKAMSTAEIRNSTANNAKLRYEGYKKLSEYMTGESALDKQFAIMEKRGMSLGLDATEQKRAANELSKWYEDMRATAFAEVQKKFGVKGSIEDFLRQEISDTSNRGKPIEYDRRRLPS